MGAGHMQEGGFVLGGKEHVDRLAMSEWASAVDKMFIG